MNGNALIPLFYFSGTGNTWWVSQRLVDALCARGFNASAHSIEQVTPDQVAELIQSATIIGLGFPIYGSDTPRVFRDFLSRVPILPQEKPVIGYVTQLGWSSDGCNFLDPYLRARGYHLRWAAEIDMPDNICLDGSPFPYSSDYESFEPLLASAQADVTGLADRVASGQTWRQHSDLLSAALAWVQRAPFRLIHDFGRKFWSVDPDLCISCGLCERNCPTSNIRMQDGLPEYGLECTYCMRCFNYCPTLAVRYFNSRNKRVAAMPPYRGPVPEFHPGLITGKHENVRD